MVEPDYSQILVVKARRIADMSVARQSIPSSRADLFGIIRQRIRHSGDDTLSALSISLTGITYFLETEYGMDEPAAQILAAAACDLIERHGA
jgi:hypothetical protein